MNIKDRGLSKDKIFGYIGFIASILTIADLMKKYLFTDEITSFSLTKNSALELFFIVFLMLLSIFFLSKEKKNTDFLTVAGYLYASISFLIYIVTAYQYILGNKDIQNFSLEIFLIFITSFISAILIFKQLKDIEHFNKYAYLFVIGLFIVLAMLFYQMVIQNDSQMKIFQVLVYMLGGTGLFNLLFFFGKNRTSQKKQPKTTKIEEEFIDDDVRW
jgi:hypothetical protein